MPSGFWAVLCAGLSGQLAAALVGAVPWIVLPLCAGLYAAGAWFSARASDGTAAVLRWVATAGAVAVASVGLLGVTAAEEIGDAKGTLGTLLLGIQVMHALVWRAERDLRTGLLVGVGLLVLGASYAPDVLVGLPLLVGWVAVLLALGGLTRTTVRGLLAPTALAVVLGLVAFLLVPVPVAAAVRSRLAGFGTGAGLSRATQGAGVFSNDRLDLRNRGALGQDPVVEVDAASPALWRSSTFDTYDGTSWTRPSEQWFSGTAGRFEVGLTSGPVRTDTVRLLGATDGTIWAPGLLTSVEADPTKQPFGVRNELGDVKVLGVSAYRATSELAATDPALLQSVTGTDAPDPRWRLLPQSLPSRVDDLARQITVGTRGRWAASEAIAQWLRTHATYRLDSPVPSRGEDAVDRFLFVDRSGFCEQFASAQVVLLRSLGIPARLVTGLAYGAEQDGVRTYRVKDLHAWTELWVPGAGWVTSDPTAGVPLAESAAPGLRSRVSAAITSGLRSLTAIPGGRPALALLLLVAATSAALLLPRVPRRRRRVPQTRGRASAGPALAAFLRLDERLGPRRRRPAESLSELRGRLDPTLASALTVVEQECYGPTAPDVRSAVEVLDRY